MQMRVNWEFDASGLISFIFIFVCVKDMPVTYVKFKSNSFNQASRKS
jgi:hypothetical protein